MTLETGRYRRALQLALSVAGRAATLEECRARLSTALNLIDKLGGSMQGEKLLREVEKLLTSAPRKPAPGPATARSASGGGERTNAPRCRRPAGAD
jgi:hypothetical protein